MLVSVAFAVALAVTLAVTVAVTVAATVAVCVVPAFVRPQVDRIFNRCYSCLHFLLLQDSMKS